MKTKILKVLGTWSDVVDDCRATVGKESLGHEPSTDFKRKILIAEHSQIRNIIVKFKWDSIKYWIAMHWSRHLWYCAIKTQRSDRTGIDRGELPQDAPVNFTGTPNAQHLIDTWRKRLCYQAAPETREYAEDFKIALHDVEPEISDVLVPNCVYRGFCPEMKTCGYWKNFLQFLGSYYGDIVMDGEKRYKEYNRYFLEQREGKDAKNGKKPIKEGKQAYGILTISYYCPSCGNDIGAYHSETGMLFKDEFCRECGQKIGWSEENGN